MITSFRSTTVHAVARRVRALASLREVPLFYLAKVFTLYRQALLQIGENMVKQTLLDQGSFPA